MPIDGIIGMRVVQTDMTASGTFIVNQAIVDGEKVVARSATPLDAKTNNTQVLPSFNLRLPAMKF